MNGMINVNIQIIYKNEIKIIINILKRTYVNTTKLYILYIILDIHLILYIQSLLYIMK